MEEINSFDTLSNGVVVYWEDNPASAGLLLFSWRMLFSLPNNPVTLCPIEDKMRRERGLWKDLDRAYRVWMVEPSCIHDAFLSFVDLETSSSVQQGADILWGNPTMLTYLRREFKTNLNRYISHEKFTWQIVSSVHCPCHTMLVGILMSTPWETLCQVYRWIRTPWDMVLLQMVNYFHFVFIIVGYNFRNIPSDE